jgi:hypothetical protein
VSGPDILARVEAIIDTSGVAARIEVLLPLGVRPRQLAVRTLLVGMLASAADSRPAHLSRAHAALVGLPEPERARLGVIATWKTGPHTLTYRQVEYTFGLVVDALATDTPDGSPSPALCEIVDALVEAGIPDEHKNTSSSLAVDWSDLESWALAPHSDGATADPEASWGHRRSHAIGQKDELFYGYYFSAATMVADEAGRRVPELVRRITLTTCSLDPVPAFVPILERLAVSGVTLGDVLADSGYAHRIARNWALPLRALGAEIVTDLHPSDRGPHGTFAGAICHNGNLYCPATPTALFQLGPLPRGATAEQTTPHDRATAELARYKLGAINADDADGYHRVGCPAVAGKLRCPQRPQSMTLGYDRPEILAPPQPAPACCTQKTLTVPVTVNAKTRQKHDYPSAAWRASYARRSGAERSYSTLKDPASNNINRGWCRLTGLTPILLFLTATTIARNLRVQDSFEARQAENTRRATAGRPPRTRRRQRKTISDLAAANAPP